MELALEIKREAGAEDRNIGDWSPAGQLREWPRRERESRPEESPLCLEAEDEDCLQRGLALGGPHRMTRFQGHLSPVTHLPKADQMCSLTKQKKAMLDQNPAFSALCRPAYSELSK